MKNLTQLLIVFILSINSHLVYANAGDMYLLPKLGFMKVDLTNAEDLASLGLLYGVGLSKNISFEAELNASLNVFNDSWSGGEYELTNADGDLTNKGSYQIWTLAGYAVYRVPVFKSFYLKGKLGVLYENVERTETIPDPNTGKIEGETTNDTGVAGGLGFGFYMGKRVTMELEATLIDKDITFYSLGLHIRF